MDTNRSASSPRAIAVVCLALSFCAWAPAATRASRPALRRSEPVPTSAPETARVTSALPMAFEPNVGQTDARAKFVARGKGYAAFVTTDGITLSLVEPARDASREPRPETKRGELREAGTGAPRGGEALRMRVEGARAETRVVAGDRLPGVSNYLTGRDETAWHRDVPTYATVRAEGIVDGVDAVYYGREGSLEYDLVVAPGADPGRIRIAFEGQSDARVNERGDVELRTGHGTVVNRAAVAHQGEGTAKRRVAARYALEAGGRIGIEVGEYDRTKPLVVDPVLEFADLFGGSTGFDSANDVAVDASGATYVTGETQSTDFPTTTGALDTSTLTLAGFVTKLDPTGAIVYSTLLGGSSADGKVSFAEPEGIAVAAGGAVVVSGDVYDPDGVFPTTPGAYDRTWNGGSDAFVSKLSADGSSLVFSTFLGGAAEDAGGAVAVDGSGAIYFSGSTNFQGTPGPFPVTAGAYDTVQRNLNGFVAKLDPTGSTLVYSTFVGGAAYPTGLALASGGDVVVAGYTFDAAFATTPGAYDTTFAGPPDSSTYDAFVLRLSATGASAAYATFLGGTSADFAYGVAVDAAGAAYVTGTTSSFLFPTTPGVVLGAPSPFNSAFLTKLAANGASLVYSTYLGGNDDDWSVDVAVDATGAATVAGYTNSTDYPTTSGAAQTANAGDYDMFVTKLSPTATSYVASTLHGGAGDDKALALALDPSGGAVVAGYTASADYPVVGAPPAPQRDDRDGAVARFSPTASSVVFSRTLGGVVSLLGATYDEAGDVAVDASGAIYVVGAAQAANFPTTPGAFEPVYDGFDAFAAKLSADGSPLFITFLGGASGYEYAQAVAVDASGVYVAGATSSSDFPVTAGAYDVTIGSTTATDGFVAKLALDGASLAYCSYLGGSSLDIARGVAVDAQGSAYVAGSTLSGDFPTTLGAADTTPGAGGADGFVSKFSPDGSSLVYSSAIGGGAYDYAQAVAVDATGRATVAGYTSSADFPVTPGAYDTTVSGDDAFVVRLNPTASAFEYATLLGGSDSEFTTGVAVDGTGAAFVVGLTNSPDYPVTPGAVRSTADEIGDGFLTKLNATGTGLEFSTYVGGSSYDEVWGLALAPGGRLYVCGTTYSGDFSVTPDGFDLTPDEDFDDAFLSEYDASTGALVYSTYYGGSNAETANSVAAADDGSVVIAGYTSSRDLAATVYGYEDYQSAFVAKLRPPAAGSVPGDTPGVYSTAGAWFLKNTNAGGNADLAFTYGGGGALVPIAGDWNGDGVDTPGLYAPATGAFFLRNSNTPGAADLVFTFGAGGAGIVPIAGDWNGDGVDTVGIYVTATGTFFLKNANAPGNADLVFTFGPGGSGVAPLVGDWNGDGADTVGIYASATGTFFLKNANAPGNADLAFTYGPPGQRPLAGDWNDDGIDTVGIYTAGTGTWFLRNTNASGVADVTFAYGPPNATPIAGNWDGQ